MEDNAADRSRHRAGSRFRRWHLGGAFPPDFEPKPGDVVAQEHWLSSGFANTDRDFQLRSTVFAS